ncbi:hypothetical protein LINPERPRIM_LOCUS3107 [Linum perenne]
MQQLRVPSTRYKEIPRRRPSTRSGEK